MHKTLLCREKDRIALSFVALTNHPSNTLEEAALAEIDVGAWPNSAAKVGRWV